ncbi:hypothetical protein [Pseudoalteromonas sp. S16_S37]|uniref:hypothetical protein n=1 Tax=Pseudoalteromonas sp. S16_S37 TaxID=2720228 RepID=UPI001680DCCF|nr:hypothetical protein [Pseudoalteromonas sp. S16_S37]MBD1581574.1 hypothetical protein [Pseudoalteromonas sp. S16_S37]
MKINIEISNQYGYNIAVYPYNNGALPSSDNAEVISKLEGKGALNVGRAESAIVDIPGMGSLLVQFMGEQKLSEYHDKFCEHPDEFDQCEQMVLIRYKTSELYWRFPSSSDNPQVTLSVNDVGTVCVGKTSAGSIRQVALPELFIPPVFSVHPMGYEPEESQQSE